ncbi:hypothetical protein [Enterococcus sp. AZ192]|uniref:hypothetical protein n=1 Tax=unclassified Enterococcus TaxID=2608891 RepID=UPI003D2A490C
MPISMMFTQTNSFYENGITIGGQMQMLDQDGLGMSEGEGHLFVDPTDKIISFDQRELKTYNVDYDHRYETQGFVFERSFKYYFQNFKFRIYHDNNANVLLVSTKKDIAKSFLNEVSKERKNTKNNKGKLFDFTPIPIDFNQIVAKAENLSGLWSQVNRGNVHSQAYYGENINFDEEVQLTLKEKNTSYVLFESNIGGIYQKIGITKHGNVVLYNNFESEIQKIKTAFKVYDLFLS